MKKHQGGYVLPFVLVVLVVICLATAAAMGFSAEKLTAQKQDMTRMQLRYELLGRVEQLRAALDQASGSVESTEEDADVEGQALSQAHEAVASAIEALFPDAAVEQDGLQWRFSADLSENGTVVGYAVRLLAEIHVETRTETEEPEEHESVTTRIAEYTISVMDLSWENRQGLPSGGDEG